MEKKWIKFREGEEARDILLEWRKELSKHTGDRAALKRARTPLDVAQVGFYHVLVKRLRKAGYQITQNNRDAIAIAAALVARIRTHVSVSPFACQMSVYKRGTKTPLISKMRLRRILMAEKPTENPENLLMELSSAIRIMGERANITDLAESVINWNDYTRRDWLYRYHGNSNL